jgi:hypothetical protein
MTEDRFVTLFDVDNTLLDNDRVVQDLMRHMTAELGKEREQEYWRIFEALRHELGYADYLGALQRYRVQYPRDTQTLTVSSFLVNYPFANRLFPESLDVVDRARTWGDVAIVSDGDVVFQPRKIERSGLLESVRGNVLIYIHKEQELDDIEARHPAGHYVVVDDKLWLLDAMKRPWGARDHGVAAAGPLHHRCARADASASRCDAFADRRSADVGRGSASAGGTSLTHR